jgi:DNA-binding NtrC family response regulator
MLSHHSIRILIVDDQQSIRSLCAAIGQGMGLACLEAETAEAALQRVKSGAPELMLADLKIGKMSGLELLAEVKKLSPATEVVLMGAYGTIESAVEATRLGAYDFVVKPFRIEELKLTLERIVQKVLLVRENEFLRSQMLGRPDSNDLEELERLTVERVFEQVSGNKEQAQKLLGISRATLYRKIKRYGIPTQQKRQRVTQPQIHGLTR